VGISEADGGQWWFSPNRRELKKRPLYDVVDVSIFTFLLRVGRRQSYNLISEERPLPSNPFYSKNQRT
jgi:hypothetical protein